MEGCSKRVQWQDCWRPGPLCWACALCHSSSYVLPTLCTPYTAKIHLLIPHTCETIIPCPPAHCCCHHYCHRPPDHGAHFSGSSSGNGHQFYNDLADLALILYQIPLRYDQCWCTWLGRAIKAMQWDYHCHSHRMMHQKYLQWIHEYFSSIEHNYRSYNQTVLVNGRVWQAMAAGNEAGDYLISYYVLKW